jgi:c-di-GMP-related signal transduction protein
VLAQLPISAECRDALGGQENSLSRILQLMVACERGEWGLLSRLCSTLDTAESVVWGLYTQATQWARSFAMEK